MAGFKFEVGIKKGIRMVKDDWLLNERKNLLQDWAQEVEGKAQELARRPTGYPDHARGVRSGKMVGSIKISDFEPTASGKSLNLRIYADEAATMTETGPYVRFQEYGTGEHTTYPGQARHMIGPKHGKRMTWKEHGPAYRGKYIKAHSLGAEVRDYATPKPKPRKLGKAGQYLPPVPESRPWLLKRKQKAYIQRGGPPYQQIAEKVKGVQPRWFMQGAARWAKTKLAEKYREWRDDLAKRYAHYLLWKD